jgi:hypothetical protein
VAAETMHERIATEVALTAARKGLAPVRARLTDQQAGELFGVLFDAAKEAVRSYLAAVARQGRRLNPTGDPAETA